MIDLFLAGDWGNENPRKESPHVIHCVRDADRMSIFLGEFNNIP